MTCIAESGVTFVDLVEATLAHGLVPIVVPELKTITIGGAVAGCSIESMSFRYGGFHDTCLEYEVITANGEVLTCTPDNEHALVFQMMHGSFGTLGILTKLTFQLVPAKPFVRVDYEKYATLADYQRGDPAPLRARRTSTSWTASSTRPTSSCCASASFVDERAVHATRTTGRRSTTRAPAKRREDYLQTPDYFFRYDRGVTNVHPKSFARPAAVRQAAWTRAPRCGSPTSCNFLFKTDSPTVTLDVFLPFSKVARVPRLVRARGRLLPAVVRAVQARARLRVARRRASTRACEDELFLDLAIYGMRAAATGTNIHRMIEEKLRELGGIKTLISHNYYSRDEFWSIWNKRNYDAVKAITDPENVFRDLYTKTCRAARGL